MKLNFDVNIHLVQPEELLAIKKTLAGILDNLMRINSKMAHIDEFLQELSDFTPRFEAAVSGLTDDIERLNAQIQQLVAFSPEQQDQVDRIKDGFQSFATRLEALDALSVPEAPPVEPPVSPEEPQL